jgi:hypothetical protein
MVDKLERELEAERAARAVAEGKLASSLGQVAEYEKRLFGRTTERVVPVDRELRESDVSVERDAAADSDAEPAKHDRTKVSVVTRFEGSAVEDYAGRTASKASVQKGMSSRGSSRRR